MPATVSPPRSSQEAFEKFAGEKVRAGHHRLQDARMNGLELIRRIRERTQTVPIILISGYARLSA